MFKGEVYWLHKDDHAFHYNISPLNHYNDNGDLLAESFMDEISFAVMFGEDIMRFGEVIGTKSDLIDYRETKSMNGDDLQNELGKTLSILNQIEHDSIEIAKSSEQVVYMLRAANNQADIFFHALDSIIQLCKSDQYINRDRIVPIIRDALMKSIEKVM